MVALLTSVRNSPCFGGLRRTKTCHRQLFARPSTCFLVTFCTTQKVTIRSLCREHRGSVNLESAHPNNTFPLTKLKPFQKGDSRFSKPRISPPEQQLPTNIIKTFLKEGFEVLQTSNQRTKLQLRTNLIKTFENFYILFVRHKKYDKKAFAPFGAARSACIPPLHGASLCCCRNNFRRPAATIPAEKPLI